MTKRQAIMTERKGGHHEMVPIGEVSGQADDGSVTQQTGFPNTAEGVSAHGTGGRPKKWGSNAERMAAKRAAAKREGWYTKGHVAGCPCPECLARRGLGDEALIVGEGESSAEVAAGHSETGMFYSADARRPKDVPYWDWFYGLHPEIADHRKG